MGKSNLRPKGGFTIHGGLAPGSAGCIDLVTGVYQFLYKVKSVAGSSTRIPLRVNYGGINGPVNSPF